MQTSEVELSIPQDGAPAHTGGANERTPQNATRNSVALSGGRFFVVQRRKLCPPLVHHCATQEALPTARPPSPHPLLVVSSTQTRAPRHASLSLKPKPTSPATPALTRHTIISKARSIPHRWSQIKAAIGAGVALLIAVGLVIGLTLGKGPPFDALTPAR
jgi:hypothetical protein